MKLLFLFIFPALFCFSQKSIDTYYDYNRTQPDEVYLVNDRGQKNGLYTKYDSDGSKALEANYVNGLLNGPCIEYYRKNGTEKIKIIGNFSNDKKQDLFTTYTYVKYDQSYYEIMNNMYYNDKSDDIFNTGLKVKVRDEYYDKGEMFKEVQYHKNGKLYFSTTLDKTEIQFTCYNEKSVLMAKGNFNSLDRIMIGTWVVPREENGESPTRKNIPYGEPNSSSKKYDNVVYVQYLNFTSTGRLDTNYVSKSYYLSGKLKDSVKLKSIYFGGDLNEGINYCGSNLDMYGPYRSYYETGVLKIEGEFALRDKVYEKVGIWKNYDETGKLLSEIDYDILYQKKQEEYKLKQEKLEQENLKIEHDKKIQEKLTELLLQEINTFSEVQELMKTKSPIQPLLYKYETEQTYNGYIYVFIKKPELYNQFNSFQTYFLTQKEKNKNTPENLITISERHINLNKKMKDCVEVKTNKLEKSINSLSTIEEKITFFENFIFEKK